MADLCSHHLSITIFYKIVVYHFFGFKCECEITIYFRLQKLKSLIGKKKKIQFRKPRDWRESHRKLKDNKHFNKPKPKNSQGGRRRRRRNER